MNDKHKEQGNGKNSPSKATQSRCSCEGIKRPGKSQKMKQDETTAGDITGASNYERAESDQSQGIFAEQTEAYNKAMDEIIDNDEENAKDNLSDYMDELKEESETLGARPRPRKPKA